VEGFETFEQGKKMKKQLLHFALAWLVGLMGATQAGALSPGSADRKAALPNVCDEGRSRGEVCDPTDVDPCGVDRRGVPYECVVDFPVVPTLRGTMTLVANDSVGDNDSSGGNPTITVLLEFRKGSERYFVAKTFQSDTEGVFPEIGHWAAPSQASEIDEVIRSFVYQTPVDALEGVGEALEQIAEAILKPQFDAAGKTPVIFDVTEFPSGNSIDQYPGTELGHVARFQIEIKFVEP
jgi:hypothetical protein